MYDDNYRSVFTVITYLNEDFTGGVTKFIEDEKCVEIVPRIGNAVVFNHDILHEGAEVLSGSKYILRTDIMFRRLDTHLISNPLSFEMDKEYHRAEELYQKSIEEQKKGHAGLSTQHYLEALEIQAKLCSIRKTPPLVFAHKIKLPMNILRYIFFFLGDVREVCKLMLVSKAFRHTAMDGALWGMLYRRDFPHFHTSEQSVPTPYVHPLELFKTTKDISKDWFGAYKYRRIVEKEFRVVFVDFSEEFKFGDILLSGFDVCVSFF